MAVHPGAPIAGQKINVAFIGSCTNGRLSDFETVVRVLQGKGFKVAPHVQALVVPGSMKVKNEMETLGWDKVFTQAGFEFREAGCSMCLAMNPDKLTGNQVSASSSKSEFQGSAGLAYGSDASYEPNYGGGGRHRGRSDRRKAAIWDLGEGVLTMQDAKRIRISGTGIILRGNDIDTDRIIPARYLRTVVFEGLGEHAFEDDRAQLKQRGQLHPFDEAKYASAEILFVNKNFGCGSSRRHAPQAILRRGRGIKAIVGESFAEIFFGNCVSLGIPCAVIDASTMDGLMAAIENEPNLDVTLDVQNKTLKVGVTSVQFQIGDGVRQQFLDGRWDTTAELLANKDAIIATSKKLPYFSAWN